MAEHEFEPLSARCVHCGTIKAHHMRVAQPCVPSWHTAEALRPVPKRREYAIDDALAISAGMAYLRAVRDAILNAPAREDAT